jgi:hypothetical protein
VLFNYLFIIESTKDPSMRRLKIKYQIFIITMYVSLIIYIFIIAIYYFILKLAITPNFPIPQLLFSLNFFYGIIMINEGFFIITIIILFSFFSILMLVISLKILITLNTAYKKSIFKDFYKRKVIFFFI